MIEAPRKVGRGTPAVQLCGNLTSLGKIKDDEFSLNRSRREKSDWPQKAQAVLRPRKTVRFSTFNARTLREDWRLEEALSCMSKFSVDILGVQEHRRVSNDKITFFRSNGYQLVTVSAWRNTQQAATGGVGLILSKKAVCCLCKVEAVSKRILKATFAGNPKTTVIVAYSPTNMSTNDAEVDCFYDNLRKAIDETPPHHFLTVLGDMNAKVSSAHVKYAYDQKTNRNGKMLLELTQEKSLCITNTKFQKRIGKRWTFEGPKGDRSMIDYILVNNKWVNSVRNVEAYSSFETVGSDHRVVTMEVCLSLRKAKTMPKKPRYEWKLLRYDTTLQQKFSLELRNKFNVLHDENSSATEQYSALIIAKDHAAKKVLPVVKTSKQQRFSNRNEVIKARKEIQEKRKQYSYSKSSDSKKHLQKAKEKLGTIYKELELERLKEQVSTLENYFKGNDAANAWKIVNSICNRKKSPTGRLTGKTPEERVKQWYTHFKNLLGVSLNSPAEDTEVKPLFDNIHIVDTEFTLEEYKVAKKQLKEGKAPGEDGITAEVFKRCDIDDIVLKFANKFLMKHQKPDQWSTLNIITVPKKGDLSSTGNYRGISLASLTTKLVNRMILNRIRTQLDPHLRYNQNGFRAGRSTTSQVLALRRVIEGVKRNHLPSVMVFIDFRKAFDSIYHQSMFKILEAYGIPKRLVKAISLVYEGLKAKVLSPDGDTDYFDIHQGVMQGDTLAPYLFVIVLDYAMRQALAGREEELGFTIRKRQSSRNPAIMITDLDFADDIALLSNDINQARAMVTSVEIECAKIGLRMNAKKTKAMFYNVPPQKIETIEGQEIEQALVGSTGEQDFKYLGSWVDSKDRDISVRKAAAWQALNKLGNIWKSDLDTSLKLQLFRATVESVLLYGSSTWPLTETEERKLDQTYTRMLRKVHNVTWKDKITNKELYGDMVKISSIIRRRRLQLAGHSFRDQTSPAHHLVTWSPKHGRKARGRPVQTFLDTLLRDTGLCSVKELESCMLDRKVWHSFGSVDTRCERLSNCMNT